MSDSFNASSPVLTASIALARRLSAAEVAAFGAVQTATLNIAALPPNTLVKRVLLVTNGQAAGVTTLLFSLGFTATGYTDYVNARDLISDAAATVTGVVPTATGVTIPCAAVPSATAETPIKAVLTCSTGTEKLNAVTGLDLSIYLECVVLPS